MTPNFKSNFVDALLHFLYNFFVYFLFIVPLDLWKKAVNRLAEQRSKGTISISKIDSPWPFLSFIKAFTIDFLIHGFIFMSYLIGLLVAIIGFITEGAEVFFPALIATYFAPLGLSLVRDFLQLLVLPFKKFLSWAKKPAQYMDLKVENK